LLRNLGPRRCTTPSSSHRQACHSVSRPACSCAKCCLANCVFSRTRVLPLRPAPRHQRHHAAAAAAHACHHCLRRQRPPDRARLGRPNLCRPPIRCEMLHTHSCKLKYANAWPGLVWCVRACVHAVGVGGRGARVYVATPCHPASLSASVPHDMIHTIRICQRRHAPPPPHLPCPPWTTSPDLPGATLRLAMLRRGLDFGPVRCSA
jgi:hypothetical protein